MRSGSIAPKSVVPAVATTAIGTSPAATQSASALPSAPASIRRSPSTGTVTTASSPRPSTRAAFWTLKCPSTDAKIRSSVGSSVAVSRARSRASSSPWRLDWVPPLVKIPSAPGPKPIRPQVQSTRCRSTNVPPTDWSKVSRLELTADTNTSASSAGITTGQLRWAAYDGSWNHTASSR